MTDYIRQIAYDLRNQRMVTVTSVTGTAFAIFLVMAVFITQSVYTVEVAPETDRNRILVGKNIDVSYEGGSSSGMISYDTGRKFYEGLDGVEKVACVDSWKESGDVGVADGDIHEMMLSHVDNVFWEIYDFDFVAGKPFDAATVGAALPRAIIAESASIRLFGNTDAVGKEIKVNHVPYVVQGVVADVSPLMSNTYAGVYLPYVPEAESDKSIDGLGGNTEMILLLSPDADIENVKRQVKARYAVLGSQLDREGKKLTYHGQPYTSEELSTEVYSNTSPDVVTPFRMRMCIYAILLLLPAINLSSMTRSRLRRRVSEIGVRRAFGCTRAGIMGRFLGENLVMTLAGGILGFILCVVFAAFFSNMFYSYGGIFAEDVVKQATPTFRMLVNMKTFLTALILCLVLNLLSTGLPAWRASRVNPAEAISGRNN